MANKKHAALIHKWLNGAKIQWRYAGSQWRDCDDDNPEWSPLIEYRVKPVEPEREYPKTQMSPEELDHIWCNGPPNSGLSCVVVANAALRHACDSGQVLSRAEFDRAIGDRAARDVAVATEVLKSLLWVFQPTDKVAKEFDQDYLLKIIERATKEKQ